MYHTDLKHELNTADKERKKNLHHNFTVSVGVVDLGCFNGIKRISQAVKVVT